MPYHYLHGKLDQTPFLVMCFDLVPWSSPYWMFDLVRLELGYVFHACHITLIFTLATKLIIRLVSLVILTVLPFELAKCLSQGS
jgi:hypothetical protein